jgi:hypothetical protein
LIVGDETLLVRRWILSRVKHKLIGLIIIIIKFDYFIVIIIITSDGRTLGSSFDTLVNRGAQNHSNMAKQVRDGYATFFSSEQGSVNWQSSHVMRGYV